MPALASTIFKIKAISDYISPSPHLLSFRKGQPFYALSADSERGIYFVSTQYATPFARAAVSGMVPIRYFQEVDLMSKDNSAATSQSNTQKTDKQRQAAVAEARHTDAVSKVSVVPPVPEITSTADAVAAAVATPIAAVATVSGTAAAPVAHVAANATSRTPVAAAAAKAHVVRGAPHTFPDSARTAAPTAPQVAEPNAPRTALFRLSQEWAALLRAQPHVIFADVMSVRAASAADSAPLADTVSAHDEFKVKVIRGACSHIVMRSTPEIAQLHRQLVDSYPAASLPEFPLSEVLSQLLDPAARVQKLEVYLNTLVSYPWRTSVTASQGALATVEPNLPAPLSVFFQPQSDHEAAMLYQSHIRRDSGFDDPYQLQHNNQSIGKMHDILPWTIQKGEQDLSCTDYQVLAAQRQHAQHQHMTLHQQLHGQQQQNHVPYQRKRSTGGFFSQLFRTAGTGTAAVSQ
ncbi:hypothetical protein BASA50_011210 [Batrachochytrium salamandrivorans]|uniref:PX domain-containing protein n=1 Tax=Batrachochytrium salamandrivorans TaxID=1357716 RepID=A0ABQ8EW03_9FUNG|nr:hypothetical protein BASA60_008978 [Batrachochytrium salamandrivorans]KAH6587606.1 hypothetical protein BASA50_011210 [Batrachochytrium salamandrivorans]KAH6603015.1 hypothetical protein BASA61_000545 [Batrachochytrium salamandrivorans]KAH9255869.1 hypothetical protein BASA81_006043 [Batrachochytrium salamandrivorans]KAJ1330184.1 hypothetical protein BSLG_009606 [Batrachochytrium salamandrivorans]